MIVMDGEEFLTAQEACAMLGVKAATLYAYVSRGLLNSYRQGIRRTRLYRRNEIERLSRLRGPVGAETPTGANHHTSHAHTPTPEDADDPGAQDAQDGHDGHDGHKWIPYV